MELKWLEDFVSLAETRSFSRSAALRHVSQPAFSRRIQALESWLGTELIDRSVYPTRLTAAGIVFHEQALTMLSQANEARVQLRGQSAGAARPIDFAVPHTLSLTYFPQWLARAEQRLGRLNTRLRALNVHDAVLALVEGGCDLVMGYHHPSHPVPLDPGRYDMLVLDFEQISPYAAPGADGQPRFSLPGSRAAPIPYLSYTANAYLGRMTDVILAGLAGELFLEKVYETDMAEGLKAMALAGHGMAFLPHSAVAEAVAQNQLVRLDAPVDAEAKASRGLTSGQPLAEGRYGLSMEIRLYRDKLALDGGAEGSAVRRQTMEDLWSAAVEFASIDAARSGPLQTGAK